MIVDAFAAPRPAARRPSTAATVGKRPAFGGRDRAAVQVEADDLAQDLGRGDVHGRVDRIEHGRHERVVLRRRHEHRPDRAVRIATSAPHHERRLGDEEAPLGLDAPAELADR